jgi:hypothetical protein
MLSRDFPSIVCDADFRSGALLPSERGPLYNDNPALHFGKTAQPRRKDAQE